MTTLVYGGGFDCPHLAHEGMLRAIVHDMKPTRIIIVPSGPREDKVYKVALEHRAAILDLFAQDLADLKVELCSEFMMSRETDGTTIGVDRYFREKFGHSPTQVFGTDVIPHMKSWDPTGYVEREIPKIFVVRKGALAPDFSKVANYQIFEPELPSGISHLSSTLIRENVKKGIYEGLSPRIATYIQEHKLYL